MSECVCVCVFVCVSVYMCVCMVPILIHVDLPRRDLHFKNINVATFGCLTKWFRDSREKCPEKALPFTPSSVVDGNSNAGTFRDVVESNGNGQSHAQNGCGQANMAIPSGKL